MSTFDLFVFVIVVVTLLCCCYFSVKHRRDYAVYRALAHMWVLELGVLCVCAGVAILWHLT